MGLYNNYLTETLPEPLKSNHCFICDSAMASYNKDPEMDAFQYKCNNCNERVIIEIRGSLLTSSFYSELIDNIAALSNILSKKKCNKKNFPITTTLVSKYIK